MYEVLSIEEKWGDLFLLFFKEIKKTINEFITIAFIIEKKDIK